MKPNFKNSIVNVSATLSAFLGNDRNICQIPALKKELEKGYKNVVYICLDGLGMFPIKQNLDQASFLRTHIKKTITSVFPSTTTNATSSLYSASFPMDHGMFGWSLYIKKMKRCVDVYLGTDSKTGEPVDKEVIAKLFKFDYFFDKAKHTDYQINAVFPPYINHTKNNNVYSSNDEMFEILDKLCKQTGKNFIYCYNSEPDGTMHHFGVTSPEAKKIIEFFNDKIQKLSKNNPDTLIVITPDHGQTDITNYVELYKDEALLSALEIPPYLESRAIAFRVKPEQTKAFKREIKKYNLFKLYKVQSLIRRNYFGKETHRATLLGDYIAVVKDTKTQVLTTERSPRFKGHHTALSKREMLLPLILISSKQD